MQRYRFSLRSIWEHWTYRVYWAHGSNWEHWTYLQGTLGGIADTGAIGSTGPAGHAGYTGPGGIGDAGAIGITGPTGVSLEVADVECRSRVSLTGRM